MVLAATFRWPHRLSGPLLKYASALARAAAARSPFKGSGAARPRARRRCHERCATPLREAPVRHRLMLCREKTGAPLGKRPLVQDIRWFKKETLNACFQFLLMPVWRTQA